MQFLFLLFGLLTVFTAPTTTLTHPPLLYVSTDLGDHWQPFDQGLPEKATVRQVIEQEGKLFLLTSEHGMYVLPKGATTWKASSNGLSAVTQGTSLAVKGDLVVLGTFAQGVYVSQDGGVNWRRPFFNLNKVAALDLLFYQGALLAATDTGIWRSYDKGETWQQDGQDRTTINKLAVHNGQLYAARQNGMGLVKGKNIEWASVETEWAIGDLYSQGDYLYAVPSRGNLIRSKDGVNWENQFLHIKCSEADNLPEALWDGYQPELPEKNELFNPFIFSTSRGWIAGMGAGC